MGAIISTLLAAANAEAEAEADPAVLYGNAYGHGHYGYGYGLGGYRGYAGLGHAGYAGAGYAGLGYTGYGYATHANHAGYGLGAYGLNAGYYGVHGVAAGIKSAPCVNSLNVPVPCAGRKRRDADPEAAAYYYGGYYGRYSGYPHYGYGYGLNRYYGYGLHNGVAAHPSGATSSTFRSPQGLGK